MAYLDAGACSMPLGPTTRAPATCRASETGHRLSVKPACVEERRGPPRLRGHPLHACHGRTPRRIPSPPRPQLSPGMVVAFRENRTLGIREGIGFGAAFPWPTCSPAYASPAVSPRPAQGWLPARAGSPLAGRDSHPLDNEPSFMEVSHPPIPFDPQGLVALFYLSAAWVVTMGAGATMGSCIRRLPFHPKERLGPQSITWASEMAKHNSGVC